MTRTVSPLLTIRNEGYVATLHEAMARIPIFAFWGMTIVDVAPGSVDLALAYRDELSAERGSFQGSATGAVADIAGTLAALTLLAPGFWAVTIDYTIKFVAPSAGTRLVGRGRVVRPGETLSFCAADVFVEREGRETLCATALLTTRNVPRGGSEKAR